MKKFSANAKFGWGSAAVAMVGLLVLQEYAQTITPTGTNPSNFLTDTLRDLRFGRDYDRASMALLRGYSGDFQRLSGDVNHRWQDEGYATNSPNGQLARAFITGLAAQGVASDVEADDATGNARTVSIEQANQSYRAALSFLPAIPASTISEADASPTATPGAAQLDAPKATPSPAAPSASPSATPSPTAPVATTDSTPAVTAQSATDKSANAKTDDSFLRSLGPVTLNTLGYFLADRGEDLQDWQHAEQLTALAVQLTPAVTDGDKLERAMGPQDSHAWALYRLGKFSEARRAQAEVIRTLGQLVPAANSYNLPFGQGNSAPSGLSPDIPFHMGAIYKALGQSDKANRFFAIALDWGANEDLREEIDLMKQARAT